MAEVHTNRLPLLPISGGVIVPQMVVNVAVDSAEARAAIAAASHGDGTAVVVPKLDGAFASIGTLAKVESAPAAGELQLVTLRGMARVHIGAGELGDGDALWVGIRPADESAAEPERVAELAREYKALAAEVLEARRIGRMADVLADIDDPSTLADTAIYSPDLSLEQRVAVLETLDVGARLELVSGYLRESLADLHLREKVRDQVAEGMEKQQREFLLRRQMDAIREELGEADGDAGAEYRGRIAEADLPEHVREAAIREVDRLERMGESNPEHGWVRTWLDTVLDIPWSVHTEDALDLGAAREVLDADHYGLGDVKDRIGEFLAVRKLRAERGLSDDDPGSRRRGSGAILALVGPPGVGKTSLGESVARALGREFVRVALGGVRDEAEIRGHRRTYVGAQPGRIVRALREAGSMNPVFLLDEVDKVASDWRGDPSAALLEVLDPAQNHTFRDHYLELDLDLSEVLFIATANVLETIPEPLLNRMEVIRLDGYSDDEKQAIARTHLLPRQEAMAGLRPAELDVTDAALAEVVSRYTQEAGVRTLERRLGTIARKTATRIATNDDDEVTPVVVDRDDVREYLGRPKVHHEAAEREATPGVVTGLAVTGAGGDVLFVEATVMEGEPGLTLTGQLGDVMKESAAIALSYVRAHAGDLGIAPDALAHRHVHLHVPAGAVPKDGPSAGITMVSALVSLLTATPADPTVAMTGEVNLQGQVMPIGGVKQKLLAAHRAGIRTVVLSRRNEDDLEDVPAHVLDDLAVVIVDRVDEVLDVVLVHDTAHVAV